MRFDAEQVRRMAADLDGLLGEVGGPDEVREHRLWKQAQRAAGNKV